MECNLIWNHTRALKIGRGRSAAISIWNHKSTTAHHEVQLPLYYSHFEIAEFTEFSQYNYFIDRVGGLLKRGNRMASHLTLYMRQKWSDVRAKMVQLKQMFFRTWMRPFRTDVIYGKKLKCDSWINHTGESQSDYRDHQWFENGL